MESDVITLQDLFEFKIDSSRPTARSPAASARRASARCSCSKFEKHGIELPADLFREGADDRLRRRSRREEAPR